MPRTKISKSSKRNRNAALAEHIREMELLIETYINQIEFKGNCAISEIERSFQALTNRSLDAAFDLPFSEFKKLNLRKFSSYVDILVNNTRQKKSTKASSVKDDGYITEDSGSSTLALASYMSMTQRGRTPGPLSSAQARRNRRSRSACLDNLARSVVIQKNNSGSSSNTTKDRTSRNKMRTPMSARPKALSADRSEFKRNTLPKSPPSAFLRWPKPGEWVMSVHGSPLVAQVMPDRFANVNIPMRNGVLSLRPKKLEEVGADIVENFDPETLNQIKTLNDNLNKILSEANKFNCNKN